MFTISNGKQSITQHDWILIETLLGNQYHFQTFWHTKKNPALVHGRCPPSVTQHIVEQVEQVSHTDNSSNNNTIHMIIDMLRATVAQQLDLELIYCAPSSIEK